MDLRPDFRKIAAIYGDGRSDDRIVAHYALERRLADELRISTRRQRETGLYNRMYNALLSQLPDHPRHRPETPRGRQRQQSYVAAQSRMICAEIGKDDVFLEIGGGDCLVALDIAKHVKRSIVVEVSDALAPASDAPNFEFLQTAGVKLPLASESVSFVYSNQLMEHLHPEDAMEQLREVYRVLTPGGRYLCRTPNRVTGPHDVSRYFEKIAHGTHMKEYSYAELTQLFDDAGFARTRILVAPRAMTLFVLPRFIALAIERWFEKVPNSLHTRICRSNLVRALLGATVLAEKPRA